jgi:2-polyprenyl-6-methoxyphenol hydroxylase-like FAD-dependent oxidoreductase
LLSTHDPWLTPSFFLPVVTNPFAGLGLTTGFLDAESLADCLISIIKRGASAETLLQDWSSSRINVFRNVVDPMSRTAFYRVQDSDPDTLAERDSMIKALKSGQMTKPPSLATDVKSLEGFVDQE